MPATASSAAPIWAAAALGAVCGARTFAAPGTAALRGRFGRGRPRQVLLLAAGGEMIGDKLPMIPARTSPPALLGRVLSGAVVAGVDGGGAGIPRGWALPAGVGGLSAALSAFATQRLRAALGRSSGLPDAALGVAEDLLVLAVAALVMDARDTAPGRAPGDGRESRDQTC